MAQLLPRLAHRSLSIYDLSAGFCQLLEHLSPRPAGAVAHGGFTDSRHTRSGFGVLHVHTSAAFPDTQQMFAAGYLEGWLTAGKVLLT